MNKENLEKTNMSEYAECLSINPEGKVKTTLVVDVTGHKLTVDCGEVKINGQFIKISDNKYCLSGEISDKLHELVEKATPKKRKIYAPLGLLLCPTCGRDTENETNRYCKYCGQALKGVEREYEE